MQNSGCSGTGSSGDAGDGGWADGSSMGPGWGWSEEAVAGGSSEEAVGVD